MKENKLPSLIEFATTVLGYKLVGEDWHTSPEHRASLDFPGTVIDIWENKGPHQWLMPARCESWCKKEHGNSCHNRDSVHWPIALCGCEDSAFEGLLYNYPFIDYGGDQNKWDRIADALMYDGHSIRIEPPPDPNAIGVYVVTFDDEFTAESNSLTEAVMLAAYALKKETN